MGRILRLFEGRFGRLVLTDLAPQDSVQAQGDPAIVMQQADPEVRFLNPGEIYVSLGSSRVLAFHAAGDWLRASFPAVFAAEAQPMIAGDDRQRIAVRERVDA